MRSTKYQTKGRHHLFCNLYLFWSIYVFFFKYSCLNFKCIMPIATVVKQSDWYLLYIVSSINLVGLLVQFGTGDMIRTCLFYHENIIRKNIKRNTLRYVYNIYVVSPRSILLFRVHSTGISSEPKIKGFPVFKIKGFVCIYQLFHFGGWSTIVQRINSRKNCSKSKRWQL